jgi:hypothetical protein
MDEYQGYISKMAIYQELVAAKHSYGDLGVAALAAEQRVRELALAEHALSGDAKPAEGIQIKEFSKVVYAPNLALDWCRAHAPKYLQLDTKAFEKAASVLRDLGAPVELVREPRVSIATDLSAWLVGE